MAKDVDEIVVGANGTVWVAPAGTALPATEAATPNVAFVDVGYLSEDGVTTTDSKEINDISVWQLLYAARKIITGRSFKAAFVLRQWSPDNVELAFGGGEVTDLGSGHYKYEPPEPEYIDERSILIDWTDGDKDYRIVIPRCMSTDDVESQLTRSEAADLPLTMEVIGEDGVQPWYLLTNDPAFA